MRILLPGETPRADETVTTFQNTAPHVKHIGIGEGAFATVPPTVGAATVTVACTATEQTGLDRALTTDTVLEWVAQGELVVVPPTPPDPPDPEVETALSGRYRRGQKRPTDDDD
jgi:hypothetical protein